MVEEIASEEKAIYLLDEILVVKAAARAWSFDLIEYYMMLAEVELTAIQSGGKPTSVYNLILDEPERLVG